MNDNIVISTRVRLARNVSGYLFPSKLENVDKAKEIVRKVYSTVNKFDSFNLYFMDKVSRNVAVSLKEKYLISNDLIANRRIGAVIINQREDISIMVHEEDHIREQCFMRGFNLQEAYSRLDEIDNKLSLALNFTYDTRLGYITACPTNLGTGLRASAMLFLPAISMKKLMNEVIKEVSRLGLTVRGIYGEGSEADGYMYQISNEVTLGVTEKGILKIVSDAVEKIVAVEKRLQQELDVADKITLMDLSRRSLGILMHCVKISAKELLQHIANVKLGISLGYIKLKEPLVLDDLIVTMRPANINILAKTDLNATGRDMFRAEYVNSVLRKNII